MSEQTETAIFVAGQIILQDKSVQSWMTACSPDQPIRSRQYIRRDPDDFRFWICDFRLADHRITRSALAKILGGMLNRICLAVFRLMTNSNLVGCSTGKSAGLAPLRILYTYMPERRYKSTVFTP